MLHSFAVQNARGAFSADGLRVLTIPRYEGKVQVWDANTGMLLWVFSDFAWNAWGEVPFSPNLRYLLGRTNLWDTDTGQSTVEPGLGEWVERSVVSPDGLDIWGWNSLNHGELFYFSGQAMRWVWVGRCYGKLEAVSPSGEWLLFSGVRGPELWDAQAIQLLRTFEVEPAAWDWYDARCWFSSDGQFVLAVGTDGMGRVWDLRDRLAGLRTSQVDGKLRLRWKLGTLQSAEAINGPWQDVRNAVSPFVADPSTGCRFFRVKVE
jgi:WD40 repeat protein